MYVFSLYTCKFLLYFNSESTVFLSTPLTPSIYKSRDSLDPPLTFSLSLSLVLTHAIKWRVK